ncbi:hypothetical protein [uncultured Kordia sp.]|uniref:hypothetical protein n=1 Tax=uncultured Kordia sp. TaxID=507699 RepID=UPI002610BB2B|nr:hypothetical protein [uncultured Kordia sp.]
MKKKQVKHLELTKKVISNLREETLVGGKASTTWCDIECYKESDTYANQTCDCEPR